MELELSMARKSKKDKCLLGQKRQDVYNVMNLVCYQKIAGLWSFCLPSGLYISHKI